MGKLVVPNIFIEPILIRKLVETYDAPSLTIRTVEGYVLLDISHRAIVEYSCLDGSALKGINRRNLQREYQYKKERYINNLFPPFTRKLFKNSQNYVLPFERETFKLEFFEPYFVKTYYSLGEILGVDCGLTQMPFNFMMIDINIQYPSLMSCIILQLLFMISCMRG